MNSMSKTINYYYYYYTFMPLDRISGSDQKKFSCNACPCRNTYMESNKGINGFDTYQ